MSVPSFMSRMCERREHKKIAMREPDGQTLIEPYKIGKCTIPVEEVQSKFDREISIWTWGPISTDATEARQDHEQPLSQFLAEYRIRRKKRGAKTKLPSYACMSWHAVAWRPIQHVHSMKILTETRGARMPGQTRVVRFPGDYFDTGTNNNKNVVLDESIGIMGDITFDKFGLYSDVIIDEIEQVIYAIDPIGGQYVHIEDDRVWQVDSRPHPQKGIKIRQMFLEPAFVTDANCKQRCFYETRAVTYNVKFDNKLCTVASVFICQRTGQLMLMLQPVKEDVQYEFGIFSITVPTYDKSLVRTKPKTLHAIPVSIVDGVKWPSESLVYANDRFGTSSWCANALCWWNSERFLIGMLCDRSKEDEVAIGLIKFRYKKRNDKDAKSATDKDIIRQIKWMKIIPVDWPGVSHRSDPVFVGRRGRSLLFRFDGLKGTNVHCELLQLCDVLHKRTEQIPTRITPSMMKRLSLDVSFQRCLSNEENIKEWFTTHYSLQRAGLLYMRCDTIDNENKLEQQWARIVI